MTITHTPNPCNRMPYEEFNVEFLCGFDGWDLWFEEDDITDAPYLVTYGNHVGWYDRFGDMVWHSPLVPPPSELIDFIKAHHLLRQ